MKNIRKFKIMLDIWILDRLTSLPNAVERNVYDKLVDYFVMDLETH